MDIQNCSIHVQDIDIRVILFLNHSMRTISISRFLIEVVHQGILKAYFKFTSSIRPFLYGFFSLSYFNKCRYFNMIQYASWFDIFQTKRSVYLVESKFYWQIPIERKEKNKLLLFLQSRGHKISRTKCILELIFFSELYFLRDINFLNYYVHMIGYNATICKL